MLKNFLFTATLLLSINCIFAQEKDTSHLSNIELTPLTEEQQTAFFAQSTGCHAFIYSKDTGQVLGVSLKGKKYLFNVEGVALDKFGRYDRKNNSVYVSNLELGVSNFYDMQITPTSKTLRCTEAGEPKTCKYTQGTLHVSKDVSVLTTQNKTQIDIVVKDYCGANYGDRLFLPQNLIFTSLSKITTH